MNKISRKILKALEQSPLGPLSVHFLAKQCEDSGLDVTTLSIEDIPHLIERMRRILPFFIGKNAENVIQNIALIPEILEKEGA